MADKVEVEIEVQPWMVKMAAMAYLGNLIAMLQKDDTELVDMVINNEEAERPPVGGVRAFRLTGRKTLTLVWKRPVEED